MSDEDAFTVKKWMIPVIILLLGQSVAGIIWAVQIHDTVGDMETAQKEIIETQKKTAVALNTIAVTGAKMESFMSHGARFTPKDGEALAFQIEKSILGEVEKNYPPQWLRDQVSGNAERLRDLTNQLVELRAEIMRMKEKLSP